MSSAFTLGWNAGQPNTAGIDSHPGHSLHWPHSECWSVTTRWTWISNTASACTARTIRDPHAALGEVTLCATTYLDYWIQGGTKTNHNILHITSSNTSRFSKSFHHRNLRKISGTAVIKYSTIPQTRRYTTLWTRWAGQSPTWGRPSPQVRVESQCSYSKFL